MRLPVFTWLAGYDRGWLRGDLIAGVTVWAVLVPESLAYASIAGVSPVVGLYAAPASLIFYAAFGSSRHLVCGPMAATAALSAATVADLSPAGANEFTALTATLAITVGVIAFVAGLLRLGFLASFISEPVLKGFIIGLALTIIIGQVPKLLGVEKEEGDFFEQLWHLLGNLGSTSGITLLVGGLSLVLVVVLKERAPVVPGARRVRASPSSGRCRVPTSGATSHGTPGTCRRREWSSSVPRRASSSQTPTPSATRSERAWPKVSRRS